MNSEEDDDDDVIVLDDTVVCGTAEKNKHIYTEIGENIMKKTIN